MIRLIKIVTVLASDVLSKEEISEMIRKQNSEWSPHNVQPESAAGSIGVTKTNLESKEEKIEESGKKSPVRGLSLFNEKYSKSDTFNFEGWTISSRLPTDQPNKENSPLDLSNRVKNAMEEDKNQSLYDNINTDHNYFDNITPTFTTPNPMLFPGGDTLRKLLTMDTEVEGECSNDNTSVSMRNKVMPVLKPIFKNPSSPPPLIDLVPISDSTDNASLLFDLINIMVFDTGSIMAYANSGETLYIEVVNRLLSNIPTPEFIDLCFEYILFYHKINFEKIMNCLDSDESPSSLLEIIIASNADCEKKMIKINALLQERFKTEKQRAFLQ